MKKFELNSNQVELLLEMCTDLFTEANKIDIQPTDLGYFVSFDNINKIHWFELCVTELPRRIAENSNVIDVNEKHKFIIDLMMKRMLELAPIYKNNPFNHPVDFLFSLYQKNIQADEK